jgi:hypothetical protein
MTSKKQIKPKDPEFGSKLHSWMEWPDLFLSSRHEDKQNMATTSYRERKWGLYIVFRTVTPPYLL